MNLNLRHKVNGAIIITFLLIAVIFSAIQLPFQRHRSQAAISNIEKLLQTLVERDQEQLANEIFDVRLKAIQIRLKQMRQVKGILSICIFDNSGKFMVSEGTTAPVRDMASNEIEKIWKQSQIERIRWQGEPTLLFSQEIIFLNEHLGFIQIYYSLMDVKRDQQRSFWIFGTLLGSILLVMLIVLNVILSHAIITPIKALQTAAQFISEGNLNAEIVIPRKDELGNLANSFANMRDSIKNKINDLKRLNLIIETTSDLVSISTPDKQIIFMNAAGRKMLGWGENESLDDKLIADIHPEAAFYKINQIGIPAAIENSVWESETALIRYDGRIIPISQVIMSHKTPEGKLEYLSTIMRDISAGKEAEEEIRNLRNYLSNIIDSMPSVLIGVDKKNKVTQWNLKAEEATGIPQEEAKGQSLEKVFPQLAGELHRVKKSIELQEVYHDSRHPRQEKDRVIYDDITIYPLVTNGVDGAVVKIDDATEKVKIEEMMVQSEKMLSVGGLAAGMAHEINNPLAGMMQSANVVKSRLENVNMPANVKAADELGISMQVIRRFMEKRQIFHMIDAIHNSGLRASEIVNSMLSFARKSNADISSHYPDQLMDKILELAATDYDLKKQYDFKSIEIIKQYEENLPMLPCEGAKVQQVMLNILRNGAQAMQKAKIKSPQFILRIYVEKESQMLCIEIEDNGPGIDKEIRSKVFDPFFTTKPVGVGTGLGLSVSYFIVTENHKGTLTVSSEPGKGANFIIRLPLDRETKY